MTLKLLPAVIGDAELLAQMNKRLIEDEGSRNPMNLSQLTERMRGWLQGSWKADFILRDDQVIGYALYEFRKDQYDPSLPVVYLRQYYIEREHRNNGYGRLALQLLRRERFGPGATVEIDVLSGNPGGQRFWTAAGFEPYCITMKLPPLS